MTARSLRTAAICLVALAPVPRVDDARAQQVADSLFSPRIESPAYPTEHGPVVLLDEAHHNFHTSGGRFFAFAKTLRRDGYIVRPLRASVTRAALDSARVFVISNALHAQNEEDWFLPTPSAFTDDEIAAVKAWVEDGGSLFLIADHMPFPGAVEKLARVFGVLFANGFALNADEESGRMTYRRRDGSLADHPITRGRNRAERVDSLVTFTGQAFWLEGRGDPLLRLARDAVLLMPEEAWMFSKRTPRLSASGTLQGAALRVGKGRVAVFGEAAMFSAQVSGPQRAPMGMNDPTAGQNPQFLLNVVHWLSGVLK
ncbi:MAG TPA: DUF4350 domain-containing protein [Candidatus Krumholzibacteria bacterium]|nr:DUF4350 domain-containing protein [Candidatus Krumholzibacteria bacterium]